MGGHGWEEFGIVCSIEKLKKYARVSVYAPVNVMNEVSEEMRSFGMV